MAATPKLAPHEWANVRTVWESDPRDGFAWLRAERSLPVSRESLRKRASAERWKKRPESFVTHVAIGNGSMVPPMVAQASSGTLAATLEQLNAHEAKPFKTRETPVLDELDETEPMQGRFVREYVIDLNGTQAAIRAGYSVQTAGSQASDLLKKPVIQAAIRELRDETLRKVEAKVEELVRYWLDILRADPNALTSYRRHCCPYCHSETMNETGRRYRKYTPSKFYEAKTAHEIRAARMRANEAVEIGDFEGLEGAWYDKRRAIDPTCPECHGEGIGSDFIADTRFLPPGVAALFNGVKRTKEGIEVLLSNKEKAADQLGRFLGAFKDREIEVNVTAMNVDSLTQLFNARMAAAKARQRAIDEERGFLLNDDCAREA